MDRVQLLDQGQRRGLGRGHQRAAGHAGASDAAADRRGHPGEAQRHAGGLHRGLRRAQVGLGLAQRGLRVFVVLPADGVDLDQLGGAPGVQPRRLQAGLGACHRRLCAVGIGLKRGGVQLVEGLAGAHAAAFGEQQALHDAGGLRAHLGFLRGARTAVQLAGQQHALRFQGDHRDRSRRAFATGLVVALAAAGKHEGGGDQEGRQGGAGAETGHGGGVVAE